MAGTKPQEPSPGRAGWVWVAPGIPQAGSTSRDPTGGAAVGQQQNLSILQDHSNVPSCFCLQRDFWYFGKLGDAGKQRTEKSVTQNPRISGIPYFNLWYFSTLKGQNPQIWTPPNARMNWEQHALLHFPLLLKKWVHRSQIKWNFTKHLLLMQLHMKLPHMRAELSLSQHSQVHKLQKI